MSIMIDEAIERYLDSVSLASSPNTARTYRNALNVFSDVLEVHNLQPDTTRIDIISVDAISWMAKHLKVFSSATERLYLTAAAGFFEYVAAERLAAPNLPRMRLLIRQRARRTGVRLPQFPRENIDKVIDYAQSLNYTNEEDPRDMLRNLRDRAFIITLADTGLRVHEACSLHRGDIDWNEQRAIIVGKGDQQAVVRFSTRSMRDLQDYLKLRGKLDGSSGRPLASLPLFARHDRGAGQKVLPITSTTGRNIINQRVREAINEDAVGTITPHSFRHYYVTTVLRGSGGNLKLAQELARHKNIAVTQRYAHLSDNELDQGYLKIFDE